ncbi:hypothetical protein ARMSODRAFT_709348 [Armillaria solidipes]|uniref:Uncharacterized protein n=1 Tax=Armillaria solidipes TaxID=1076256 RepID=A0A2H3BQ23_9AGAR|nr:hypothetical protein ARMSODRAFT_709348 [Armillaria solidipes]
MTTKGSTVPSRLLCPITKAYNADTPLKAHVFITNDLSPELKMHMEWAWGFDPHQLVIKNNDNCIGYRPDILRNSINGDFVLVPTMTTLNKMLAYFLLPHDSARVYHTRASGTEFIKHRQIMFKKYMPEPAFRYLFVPITSAGEAIRDTFLKEEQVEVDYEDAFDPLSGNPIEPDLLRQFRVVTSHVHPFFVVPIAYRLLFPMRDRPGLWSLSVACHLFTLDSTNGADPPAWFRRRYKGIEFNSDYDDDDKMDVETTDEEQ